MLLFNRGEVFWRCAWQCCVFRLGQFFALEFVMVFPRCEPAFLFEVSGVEPFSEKTYLATVVEHMAVAAVFELWNLSIYGRVRCGSKAVVACRQHLLPISDLSGKLTLVYNGCHVCWSTIERTGCLILKIRSPALTACFTKRPLPAPWI
jgi:hypothetical protein